MFSSFSTITSYPELELNFKQLQGQMLCFTCVKLEVNNITRERQEITLVYPQSPVFRLKHKICYVKKILHDVFF